MFARTTRSIRLTEAGRNFFLQCSQALTQLVEAQQEVMGAQTSPSGQLRISLPTTYGHHRILPLLPKFRALYPDVTVDIHLGNRNIDFVGEGYDLAIRVRAQPDSTMVARLLEDAKLVVVASPDYLKRLAHRRRWKTWCNTNAFSSNCRAADGGSPGCSRKTATTVKCIPTAATPVLMMCSVA